MAIKPITFNAESVLICPTCGEVADDVVTCCCGREFCWNCGSPPEGFCGECEKLEGGE